MKRTINKLNKWEKFEIEASSYLNKVYSHLPVSFILDGGSSSRSSDIKVYNNNNLLFSIESKYSPSQSGQFVILENENFYVLSKDSKCYNNIYSQTIIDYLNENKEYFTPKDQDAININIDLEILTNWIITHYKNKNSYFVITSCKLNDYKSIIPIEEIGNFFEVSAVIRRKRSGTRHIAKSKREQCINELEKYINKYGLRISDVFMQSNKTIVEFNKEIELKKSERYFGNDFYLSPSTDGKRYFLKTRAKTNNLNVIFSLTYFGPKENIGIELLEKFIREKL